MNTNQIITICNIWFDSISFIKFTFYLIYLTIDSYSEKFY